MPIIANVAQSAAWNGDEGRHWAEQPSAEVAVDDRLFAAAAVEKHEAVLDVGCGTGATTRRAARIAARGRAVGVDLSATMIAAANQIAREEGLANVGFEQGDAQVHPFARAAFDTVISRFGVMFFADPRAAFANIRRALVPRGRLVFVCPQQAERCEWYTHPLAAVVGGSPHETHTPPSAMFSLAGPDRINRILTNAGFGTVELTSVDVDMEFGATARDAASFFLGSGPVQAVLQVRPDLTSHDAAARLEEALAPYQTPAGVRIPGRNWLVRATIR